MGKGADLPGDERFVPVVGGVVNVGGRLARVQTISILEQANQHHNRLRYHELQKLRMGMPNLYEQSAYRH